MGVVNSATSESAGEAQANVVVSSQAMAAIRQLRDDEQVALYAALRAIGSQGLTGADHVTSTPLDDADRAYFLRIAGAPEVRVIARELNGTMVEILDIVRPQTLHNLFHAS